MATDLCVLVCDALRREVDAALAGPLAQVGMAGVRVSTVPSCCDPGPADRASLSEQVAARMRGHGAACLLGGHCMAGLDLPAELRGGLVRVLRDSCFQLVVNASLVEGWIAGGAHLLTPGWLAGWRKRLDVWRLDRPTARQLFHESANRLLLLDTGVDPDAGAELAALGEYLGLPVETVPVGLDHLAGVLAAGLAQARELPGLDDAAPLKRRVADQGVVLDFTARLGATLAEAEVAAQLHELLLVLFAPERVVYLPFREGHPGAPLTFPEGADAAPGLLVELGELAAEAAFAAGGRGILFTIGPARDRLAAVAADGLALPRHRAHYLEMARAVARAASLAVRNARAFERVRQAEEALRKERDSLEDRIEERTRQLAAALHKFASLAEEQRQTAAELERSQQLYRTIVETAEEGIWLVDAAWKTVFANARLEAMLGVQPGQLLGRPVAEFMDEEGRRAARGLMADREAGRPAVHEFRFVRADGSSLWALLATNAVRDAEGRFAGALAMITDVGERRAEREAQERDLTQLRTQLDRQAALRGLLPLCGECKRVRDERGAWTTLEDFVTAHTPAHFSHGVCPDCFGMRFGRGGSET